jgi:acyl homoserine lactone synthase
MIDVVTVCNAHHYGDALASQFRLRHRVFIERQGYDVSSWDGMEYDQFDTPATTYLIRRDAAGEARAVTRLIPTVTPYMIGSLWPHLLDGAEPPRSPEVWEATRFGCDHALDTATREAYLGELIAGILEFGLLQSLREFICVMPAGILRRVLMRAGCDIVFLGSPSVIGRFEVVAGCINITEESLQRVRDNKGFTGSVLNIAGPLPLRRVA